jgi:recombination protein RecR
MVNLPKNIKKVAQFLELLPGIGEKTANRLALYFLRIPQDTLIEFAEAISRLKQTTKLCQICFNLTENEICSICQDSNRQKNKIMVVEEVLDILSFEKGGIYQGVYHVLHGRIDPLNHIGPEDIKIPQLLERIKNDNTIDEIILATNPDLEGEATAMYITEKIKDLAQQSKREIKISRLGYGLPIGAEIEYADYLTLKKALENRSKY